jgi:hypothetical protein
MVRFWVNLQASIQVTRKPENVRMGKGKGARKGMRAFVRVGTFLYKITSLRVGLMSYFYKKLQVRVPFKLGVVGQPSVLGFVGRPYTWAQHHIVQKKYIVAQLELYKGLLKKLHRPLILGYILRIFWWRYVIPYAIWSPTKAPLQKLRLKRAYLRRRKILLFVKPQSLGFLRQLRIKWKHYMRQKQVFKKPIWQKVQARWVAPVKNVALFCSTPLLPWDVLLRAKRFKRLLFYINFISFAPLIGRFSGDMERMWLPLSVSPGVGMPARLFRVTIVQLRIVSMLTYWRYLIARTVDYVSLV